MKKPALPNLWLLEPLEPRLAPAVLVNPSTVTYTDVDGDLVTVKFSKNVLDDQVFAEQVFKFDTAFSDQGPQQLQKIDLLEDTRFNDVSITVSVKKAGGGDGQANVGALLADSLVLKNVTVNGDLGRILVGDDSPSFFSIGKLDVGSLGVTGDNTISVIEGRASQILIRGDLQGSLEITRDTGKIVIDGSVDGGKSALRPGTLTTAEVGQLIIKGDIQGRSMDNTGVVTLDSADKISIGGFIKGGANDGTGRLIVQNDVQSLDIKGDIFGKAGAMSGQVVIDGMLGKGRIGDIVGDDGVGSGGFFLNGDLGKSFTGGNVVGGDGENSGRLELGNGNSAKVAVKLGDISGGLGENSGNVQLDLGPAGLSKVSVGDVTGHESNSDGTGKLTIFGDLSKLQAGDITGGDGDGSGRISVNGNVGKLVAGGITGGFGMGSGFLGIGTLSSGIIKGDVQGGEGNLSGRIVIVDANKLQITGGFSGGAGASSGMLDAGGNVNKLTVVGPVTGGDGAFSGGLFIGGDAGSLKLGADKGAPSIIGGGGEQSGSVIIEGDVNKSLSTKGGIQGGGGDDSGVLGVKGDVHGKAKIGGDLVGAFSPGTAVVFFDGNVNSLVVGDFNGDGNQSAVVFIGGHADKVKTGSLFGGSGDHSGSLLLDSSGRIIVNGYMNGGFGERSGAIHGQGDLGLVTVRESINGGSGDFSASIISQNGSANVNIGGHLFSGFGDLSGAMMAGGTLDLQTGYHAGSGGATLFITGGGASDGSQPAIGNVFIRGDLFGAQILGGYTPPGLLDPPEPTPFTQNATIESIRIAKILQSSQVAAGVEPGPDGFGADSTPIINGAPTTGSRIDRFVVGGEIQSSLPGTPGIAAQEFGGISVNGKKIDVVGGENLAALGIFQVDVVAK